jgi:hypothetical protein
MGFPPLEFEDGMIAAALRRSKVPFFPSSATEDLRKLLIAHRCCAFAAVTGACDKVL